MHLKTWYTRKYHLRMKVTFQDNIEGLSKEQSFTCFKGEVKCPQQEEVEHSTIKCWLLHTVRVSLYEDGFSLLLGRCLSYSQHSDTHYSAILKQEPYCSVNPLHSQNFFHAGKNKRRKRCVKGALHSRAREDVVTWAGHKGTAFSWHTESASNSSSCCFISNLVVLLARELIYSNIIDLFNEVIRNHMCAFSTGMLRYQ